MERNIVVGNRPKQNFFFRILSFSWLTKGAIIEIISLLFVILFLYTGIAKLMDFFLFEEQLAESPILEPVAPIIAWGLPITEFIVSLLLFFPRYRLKGLYASFVLMVLFTAYVIVILSIDKELPCSCGGIMVELSWQGHLIFNGVSVGLALLAILLFKRLKRDEAANSL